MLLRLYRINSQKGCKKVTTEYSISIENWQDEKWNQVGSDLMYDFYLKDRATRKECQENGWDIEDIAREKADSHFPMMNYVYPLEMGEPSEDKITKICSKTNCTVVEDTETGDFFLALTGGGMDLSQDIALAYMIAEKWLPTSLLRNVCTQPALSVSEKEYRKIMRRIKEQLRMENARNNDHLKRINEELKRMSEKEKAKNANSVIPAITA